jgi:hypothetical protein
MTTMGDVTGLTGYTYDAAGTLGTLPEIDT